MELARSTELEQATIERARRGDAADFALLVERYQTPVFNLAYRMLGDRAEAEDAAQETFLRAYAQLSSYHRDKKFATWLLSIAAHYCIDRLRRRKFRWLSLDETATQEALPNPAPGPEETAFAHEREAQVRQLLQKLSPAARAVVVLKYWSELDLEEISRITGDSVGAVKVRLSRARQAMARELQQQSRLEHANPRGLEKVGSHVQ